MNEDIKKYPIFLFKNGELIKTDKIKSTNDYNHYTHNLHHYIKKEHYEKNKSWYQERGIEQKLILVTIPLHEQILQQAVNTLDDDSFYGWYKIDRWDLLFNRKHTNY